MDDLNLPEIKRKKIQEKKDEDKKEFKDLFQSDSDSDEGDSGLKVKKGQLTLAYSFPSHLQETCLQRSTLWARAAASPELLPFLASGGQYFVTA